MNTMDTVEIYKQASVAKQPSSSISHRHCHGSRIRRWSRQSCRHGNADPSAKAAAVPRGTNNSMPMADKPYDAPEPPEKIDAFQPGLSDIARLFRETVRPHRRNYITMYFRMRRRNYEQLLWQYISTGLIPREKMYTPRCLPFWTVSMKMRVRQNYPLGRVLDAMKCRLGVTNPGMRFCLDGFFGMMNYSDIFGNTGDVCPWMEVSCCSTVVSLRLKDGDSIYISIASPAQVEKVLQWRKKHAVEVAAAAERKPSSSRASKTDRPSAASVTLKVPEKGSKSSKTS